MRLLLSKAESRRAGGLVEDNEHTLEEDVAQNSEANAGVGLDATEARSSSRVDGSVVDVAAWDREGLAANGDMEVGKAGRAAEDVATLLAVVRCAGDLLVVCGDGGSRQVHESGASVGDGVTDAAGGGVAGTHRVATCGEFPEAVGGGHRDVGNGASVLRAVNVAEVVAASGTLLEVGGEERLRKGALDSVEEGGLRSWLDGVDAAESQTKQTIVVGVLGEFRGDGGRSLNSLRSSSHATNDDLVGVDDTARTRAVTVGDVPGVAGLEGARAWVVFGVSGRLTRRRERREDPAESLLVPSSGCTLVKIRVTHRSALPVSKSKFSVCPPTDTGHK